MVLYTHMKKKRSFLREKRKSLVKCLWDYAQLVFFRAMVCVKKIENRKKKTKQSLSLLITSLSIACSAYPTVQVEKLRTKHNTQERTKLPHTVKKIKKNRCMSRYFVQNVIQRLKESSHILRRRYRKTCDNVLYIQRRNSTTGSCWTCLHAGNLWRTAWVCFHLFWNRLSYLKIFTRDLYPSQLRRLNFK